MIKFKQKGDFHKLSGFFEKVKHIVHLSELDKYGKQGVDALASVTPRDTGLTASSWYYEIENQNGVIKLNFCNKNLNEGVPIAIILQYGHATINGGWVEGIDYINPAIQPIFEEIANNAWKEVKKI